MTTPTKRPRIKDRQKAVFSTIVSFIKERGYSPTLREIQARLTDVGEATAPSNVVSTSVINYNLHQLRDKGYITWDDNKARTIKVIE